MSLESLKSAFNKIEQNQPESTDLSKGSHSFGTNGSVNDIIKIDGIGTEQSPSPLTAIYGDNGAVVNGNSENVIQINDFRNGVYNLDVGVVKQNSDIVKNKLSFGSVKAVNINANIINNCESKSQLLL